MFDIVSVEGNFLFEAIGLSAVYLSHSCDTRFDDEHLFILFIIEVYFSRLMRSWSYERHFSHENIVELGNLIE